MRKGTGPILLIVLATLSIYGCGKDSDDYWQGHKRGYEKGYKEGRAEGKEIGTSEAALKYNLQGLGKGVCIGFACGLLVTVGTIAFCRRGSIVKQIAKYRNSQRIAKQIKSGNVVFDEDIGKRLADIFTNHKKLSDKILRDERLITNSLSKQVVPALDRIPSQATELAKVLQELRKTAAEFHFEDEEIEEKIKSLQNKKDEMEDARLENDITEEIHMLSQKLKQHTTLLNNISRCESKLNSLQVFMENTEIQMANWNTLTHFDAFSKLNIDLAEEVQTLEQAIEEALSKLSFTI